MMLNVPKQMAMADGDSSLTKWLNWTSPHYDVLEPKMVQGSSD